MSLTVIMPRSWNLSLTTSTFSMRCWCSLAMTSSREAPSRTVTSRSFGVITLRHRLAEARFEAQVAAGDDADQLACLSTTGTPEMRLARVSLSTSPMVMFGGTTIGSVITPDSYFLTARTSAAWRSAVMFLWMMPMPPSCASAMASLDSVTVSIAADSSGMLRRMRAGQRVVRRRPGAAALRNTPAAAERRRRSALRSGCACGELCSGRFDGCPCN